MPGPDTSKDQGHHVNISELVQIENNPLSPHGNTNVGTKKQSLDVKANKKLANQSMNFKKDDVNESLVSY